MSQRVRNHAPYLQVLAQGNTKQRQGVIQGASKELIACVCECALNIPAKSGMPRVVYLTVPQAPNPSCDNLDTRAGLLNQLSI